TGGGIGGRGPGGGMGGGGTRGMGAPGGTRGFLEMRPGSDFFVSGVMDDPKFLVLYDPQQDNTSRHAVANTTGPRQDGGAPALALSPVPAAAVEFMPVNYEEEQQVGGP